MLKLAFISPILLFASLWFLPDTPIEAMVLRAEQPLKKSHTFLKWLAVLLGVEAALVLAIDHIKATPAPPREIDTTGPDSNARSGDSGRQEDGNTALPREVRESDTKTRNTPTVFRAADAEAREAGSEPNTTGANSKDQRVAEIHRLLRELEALESERK